MINTHDILETINMIQDENLDIRTITMGISLKSCVDPDVDKACEKIYLAYLNGKTPEGKKTNGLYNRELL